MVETLFAGNVAVPGLAPLAPCLFQLFVQFVVAGVSLEGVALAHHVALAVSYTHLDVYKRQVLLLCRAELLALLLGFHLPIQFLELRETDPPGLLGLSLIHI